MDRKDPEPWAFGERFTLPCSINTSLDTASALELSYPSMIAIAIPGKYFHGKPR